MSGHSIPSGASALILAVCMASSAMGQTASDRVGPPPPPVVTTSQTAPVSAGGDTILTVLASVYRNNPRLLAERAGLREVDENYIQARAQGRVNISAGAEASATAVRTPETPGSFFAPPGGGWEEGFPQAGQVNIVQPLYQGGRIKALKKQAKASILAARSSLEAAENNIFLAAANAYVDVLRDEETARIRRNNIRVLDRQLTASRDRFDVGEGTRTDVAQSQSRLAQAEAGLAQADAQLESSRAQFVRIVGRMPTGLAPVPNFALPASLDQAIVLARENNPQLLAAYYNELAGRAAIDVARSAGRPTVSLQGTYASSRDVLLGISESDQATLTARVNVPIFSGGLNKSRVRQAKHAKTRLAFESRDTELAVDQTVTQIWAQMEASRRIVETSVRQLDSAQIAFEGVTLEQQVGVRDQLDVLNAEQEVLNAQLTLVNAQRDNDSAVFQLLSVIGVFDADGIALPIEKYDEGEYLRSVAYDGYEQAIDRFVPEGVQKIVPQMPNLVLDPAEVTIEAIDELEIDNRVESLGERIGDLGQFTKEKVDRFTGQTPAYDPRIDDPEIEVVVTPLTDPMPPNLDEAVVTDLPDIPIEPGRGLTMPSLPPIPFIGSDDAEEAEDSEDVEAIIETYESAPE